MAVVEHRDGHPCRGRAAADRTKDKEGGWRFGQGKAQAAGADEEGAEQGENLFPPQPVGEQAQGQPQKELCHTVRSEDQADLVFRRPQVTRMGRQDRDVHIERSPEQKDRKGRTGDRQGTFSVAGQNASFLGRDHW